MVAVNTYNGTDLNNLGNVDNAISYRYADKTNYLSGITHNSSVLGTSKLDFTYGNLANGQMPDQIYSVKWNDVSKKNYTYDGLGRVTSQTVYPSVGVSLDNTYTYKDVGENNTSTQVSRVTNALGTYDYEYDANGNITKITFTSPSGSSGSYVREYQYDHLNRITSTYDSKYGYRHEYEYDTNGNIISRNRYSDYYNNGTEPDRTYTYDYDDTVWTDLLTAFCGDEITYDKIGNPISYYNGFSFSWDGRRLQSMSSETSGFLGFLYNSDGLRTLKNHSGRVTYYTYDGDQLVCEKNDTDTIWYTYDESGSPVGIELNGIQYYYIKNIQGDIVGIVDESGNKVVEYKYNVWGKLLSVTGSLADTLGVKNRLRYRGYYYDTETGLFYVGSRYYDPEIGRFINADSQLNPQEGTTGYNMFQYCGNNPVNRADPTGKSFILACIIGGAIIGALAGGHIAGSAAKKSSNPNVSSNWGWYALGGGIIGGGVGALAGWGVGSAITAIGTIATGTAGTAAAPVVQKIAEKTSTALQTYYPPNNGFSGTIQKVTIEAGTLIQRTGDFVGRFTAPAGTPTQLLSLPYDKIGQATTYFQTTQPLQALSGTVAPWFGQIGGGTQYLLLNGRVDQLLAEGAIKIFGG